MQPLDEVRSGTAIFDETLFQLAPRLYRELDRALQPDASGSVPPLAPAYLRFGSWIGADRDGNPFVTAAVTEQAARIQADHALRALENATVRIGRSLTIDLVLPSRAGAGPRRSSMTPWRPPPGPSGAARRAQLAIAGRAVPHVLAVRGPAAAGDQVWGPGPLGLAYHRAADFIADLRLVQAALAAVGATRQAYGELQHLIWQAETFGFHFAGLEVRQHSAVHASALREAHEHWPAHRLARRRGKCSRPSRRWRTSSAGTALTCATGTWSASRRRPATSPPCTSWPSWRARASRRCSTSSRCSRAGRTWRTPSRSWTT